MTSSRVGWPCRTLKDHRTIASPRTINGRRGHCPTRDGIEFPVEWHGVVGTPTRHSYLLATWLMLATCSLSNTAMTRVCW